LSAHWCLSPEPVSKLFHFGYSNLLYEAVRIRLRKALFIGVNLKLILSPPPQLTPLSILISIATMSSISYVPATSSSSNFQLIFDTALKVYEKKTKRDLLAHPLVSQLQTCDSAASILTVLQAQVDDLDQVRKSDERLTKWLSPAVNVLLAFSATIDGGVSLVRITCSRFRTMN
jgi:hypothetical protein